VQIHDACRVPDPNTIEANRQVVLQHYGLAAYAQRLLDLYTRTAASPVSTPEAASSLALVRAFMTPGRFSLLRT